jgi:arginase family enzyme
MTSTPIVVGGRTTYRSTNGERGLEAVATALGLGEPQLIGRIGDETGDRYEEDLERGRETLVAAGDAVRSALQAGERPVVVATDCSLCVSTLPAAAAAVEDLHVLWLDAHGDFNTPQTTGSGFLGGMCLAAVCGRWDSGVPGTVDPSRVLIRGLRAVAEGEALELEHAGVRSAAPGEVPELLRGRKVFIHLDVDVLDPSELPVAVPAPDGLTRQELTELLRRVAEAADVVGLEITSYEPPQDQAELDATARQIGDVVRPLL